MKKGIASLLVIAAIMLNMLIVSSSSNYEKQILSDGYYKFISAETNLDIGKIYLFEKVDNETYRIINIKTNYVLAANEHMLSEQPWKNEDSQKWILKSTSNGYTLQSKSNYSYIVCLHEDLALQKITYDKLFPAMSNYSKAQYFNLQPMFDSTKDTEKKDAIKSNVYYKIKSLANEKVLLKNKIEMTLDTKADMSTSQYFKLIKNKEDSYIIQSIDSNVLCVDQIDNKIFFAKESGNENQKWLIEVYNQRLVFRSCLNKQVLSINQNNEVELNDFDFTASTLWDITAISDSIIKPQKAFKYFAQNDPAWSEEPYSWAKMRNAGCGPTALSMITNYLSTKDANPLIVARISKKNKLDIKDPPRTDMDKLVAIVSKEFEFNYRKIDKKDIVNELKEGKMVMMATWANKRINYDGHGHFLVLRGLDKKGNIIVNDPLAMNTYGIRAESYVENYKQKFVYVAKPEDLFAKLFLAYSFWK